MTPRCRSRHAIPVAFLALGLLVAPAAPGASPKPAASPVKAAPSPTAEQIIERHVAARGGIEKLRALQTLRQEGRVNAGAGRDGLVLREIKRPGRIRFEFTVQGVTSVFASDGHRGWKVSPLEGEMGPKALEEEALADAREQTEIDGPLVDWKSKGSKVELAGRVAVEGQDAYKVNVTLKSGVLFTAFIDVKSANLVRTETTRLVRGKRVQVEMTFGDFKKTDGVVFPHLVEVRTVGRPHVLRIVVDKIEVNPALSDARFAPPA